MKIMRDEFHEAEDSPDRRANPEPPPAFTPTAFNVVLVVILLGFLAIAIICAYHLDGWLAFCVAVGMCWIWAAVCFGAMVVYDSVQLKRAYRALGETDD